MVSIIKRHQPLIIATGILYLTTAVWLILSIRQNDGHLIYTMDDTYIHMAMANNFSQHRVWGVTQYGFTSSSSSLLWTLLLSSVYFLLGTNEVSPFILNVIFATFVCVLVYILLRKYKLESFPIFVTLLLIIFFSPLKILIFNGMEHSLHMLLTISFVYLSAKILSEEESYIPKFSLLLILAPLLSMIRYEGLFLVFVVACLFIVKRKLLYAVLLGGLGILPVFIYGLFSISKGWDFLPNSVLLKGSMLESFSLPAIINFFLKFLRQMVAVRNSHVSMLILVSSILFYFNFRRQNRIWQDSIIMIIVFIATTCLHMLFAQTGWFFRYEAYLIGLGIFVIAISLPKNLLKEYQSRIKEKKVRRHAALAFFIFILLLPFVVRSAVALKQIPQATTNIYEQQYQMGLFLRKFYQGQGVAANDIGAINYLADIKNLDLWGLGNLEVAKARRGKYYNIERMHKLATTNDTKVAIVYDYWYKPYGGIPLEWINVGKWTILNNVVCGGDTVSFYAVDPSETNTLIENLRAFSSYLPKDVVQTGKYTE